MNVRYLLREFRCCQSAVGPIPVIVHTGLDDRKGSNTAV